MSLKGDNMSIELSGWYENDERIGPMKEDSLFPIFTRNDVFADIGDFLFDEIINMETLEREKAEKLAQERKEAREKQRIA